MSPAPVPADWSAYLRGFHAERPGITEDVLTRATAADGATPYAWVTEPVRDVTGRVVDIACGSGPARRLVSESSWIGVDASAGELRRAATSGAARLAQGDATRLPLRAGSADAVVCSMALMLLEPIAVAVAELARVLAPGGVLTLTVPATTPLTPRDRFRYARLFAALRVMRLGYPNTGALEHPGAVFVAHGLTVRSDTRRRFAHPLRDADAGRTLVRSLYLPDVDEARINAGVRVARRWRGEIGIPLRRIVCERTS